MENKNIKTTPGMQPPANAYDDGNIPSEDLPQNKPAFSIFRINCIQTGLPYRLPQNLRQPVHNALSSFSQYFYKESIFCYIWQ